MSINGENGIDGSITEEQNIPEIYADGIDDRQSHLVNLTIGIALTITAEQRLRPPAFNFQNFVKDELINPDIISGGPSSEEYKTAEAAFNAITAHYGENVEEAVSQMKQQNLLVKAQQLGDSTHVSGGVSDAVRISRSNKITAGVTQVVSNGYKDPDTATAKTGRKQSINDITRATLLIEDPLMAKRVDELLDTRLDRDKSDDDWGLTQTGWLKRNTVLKIGRPIQQEDGSEIEVRPQLAEIQVGSIHFYRANQDSHGLYELLRDFPEDTSDYSVENLRALKNDFNGIMHRLMDQWSDSPFARFIRFPIQKETEAEELALFQGDALGHRRRDLVKAHQAVAVKTGVMNAERSWRKLWIDKAIELNSGARKQLLIETPEMKKYPDDEIDRKAAKRYGIPLELLDQIPMYSELVATRRQETLAKISQTAIERQQVTSAHVWPVRAEEIAVDI